MLRASNHTLQACDILLKLRNTRSLCLDDGAVFDEIRPRRLQRYLCVTDAFDDIVLGDIVRR
jgi:hypothetical protein